MLYLQTTIHKVNVSKSAESIYGHLWWEEGRQARLRVSPSPPPIQSERLLAFMQGFLWWMFWVNKKEEFNKVFFNARRLLPSLCDKGFDKKEIRASTETDTYICWELNETYILQF